MLNTEQCWSALVARDGAADGTFFYGVRTTGVYCRPNCTSRLPKRDNVAFFATTGEAEAAGFRPCKRCRPTEPSAIAHHLAAVEKACRIIRLSETTPSLADLADAVGVSRFHFHRVFKQITGATPRDYARTHRLGRFAETLAAGEPVADAIYAAGYGSSSRAYEAAPAGLGMTPGARRKGGQGESIRYATLETPLGWVLVAATERGICAVELGDEPKGLVSDLEARFPAAAVAADGGALRDWAEQIVRFITAPGQILDLPLDIQGTAFQARVWRALQRIPLGHTASYAELAAALGQPNAVRAVARACASNRLALVVPCHRAVGSDGELRGYRWGVERKRALLAREREALERQRAGGKDAA